MPIGIHYNEDFAAYAEVALKSAAAGKPKSVVRTQSQPFATTEMGTAPDDGPGGFAAMFRSSASKKANDTAREIFLQSVNEIFGGESLVPPSVREALKLEDYGSGRPLTARRVLAVREAIEREMTNFAETFEKAKATAPKAFLQAGEEGRNGVCERLSEALRQCGGDREAMAIVANHADKFLLAPDESPRDVEVIRTRVDRLKASLAELRGLAKGNAAAIEVGVEFLDDLADKDLPDGLLAGLFRAAKSAKIGEIKALSGASTPFDIHKAVLRFRDSVGEALEASGAKGALKGGDELDPCRQLLGELMILRCGESGVRSVRTALCTIAASQTLAVYAGIENEEVPLGVASTRLKQEIRETAATLDRSLELFRLSANVLTHQKRDELHPYRASRPGEAKFTSPEIVKDLTAISERRIARDIQAAVDHCVKGRSPGADLLRKFVLDKLGDHCLDPAAKLAAAQSRTVRSMLNRTVAAEMRKFHRGKADDTTFAKDITRHLHARLPGGMPLAGNFEAARNQIAAFVARNPGATYEALDPVAKRKAELVMSILSQEGEKAGSYGIPTSFDPNEALFVFDVPEDPGAAIDRTFHLDISPEGDLEIRYTRKVTGVGHLFLGAEGRMTDISPESTFSFSYALRIPAAEFERLANLDYSACDIEESDQVAYRTKIRPLQAAVAALGPDFAFGPGVTCTTEFSANIPETEKTRK